MRKFSLLVLALGVLAVDEGRAQQPTFPSRVDLVTVDAVVLDREGNPVEGLTRDDFTIREDGQPQAIAAFEAVDLAASAAPATGRLRVSTNDDRADAAGRWFFVVFDDVNISQFSTRRAREAVVAFIEQALGPGDRVMIAPTSSRSTWIGELPRDREDLLAYVGRLQGERRPDMSAGRIWDHEARAIAYGRDREALGRVARRYYENKLLPEVYPTENADALDVSPGLALIQAKARQTYTEATSRMRATLGSVERIADALTAARGRKSLLFFSEGFINDPTLDEFNDLRRAAREANVAVHFVDVRSPGGPLGQPGAPGGGAESGPAVEDRDGTTMLALSPLEADGARSIALDTGGSVVQGTDLLTGLRRVAREARTYYLLGYSPENTRRDGRFRTIEVTVNRPGVTVRARRGYVAEAPAPPARRPDPDTLDPAVRAGLDSPFGADGIPLRLVSYALGPQADGAVRTLLVAEADPRPLKLEPLLGRYSATLDSYVLLHHRDRDELTRDERLVELDLPPDVFARVQERGLPIVREFTLQPGRYQATLLLRDRATGTLGSVRHEFEVPAADAFRITTPILTDTLQGGAAGAPGQPVPIARRTFRPGTRLAAAFEVLGAARGENGRPRVTASYALRDAAGAEVAAAAPQPLAPGPAGQIGATVGLPLPAGATGLYELTVIVRDEISGRTAEYREAIAVAE